MIVPAEGRRLNSFLIRNHSLSSGRERSQASKQLEAKKLRPCEDPCMPLRRRRKKPDIPSDSAGLREVVRRTDANPQLVATARFLRALIPGAEPETAEMPEPMPRLVSELQPKGASTVR